MNILITLCARGGSKGIPGKNIRHINGAPLIFYSINHAKKFTSLFSADITLSTDSVEIKSVASRYGIQTPYTRPAHLSSDTAGKVETIYDILVYEEKVRGIRYDFILDLDVSSPLRSIIDLVDAFDIIRGDPDALNLFSVNLANRNPYFNMVEQKENGYFSLIKKSNFLTRQSAPPVYDMNASFYFFKRTFFDIQNPTTISERSLIYIMPHICFDLDHPIDFEFMEYLLINNRIGFDL